jgi:hypothetical protein
VGTFINCRVTFIEYYCGDEIKENDIDGACSKRMGGKKYRHSFTWKI